MTVFYYILFCITPENPVIWGYYKLNWEQLFLKNSNLSFKDINEKYSYANQYFFSTSIKKEKGIFPSSFKEGKIPAT